MLEFQEKRRWKRVLSSRITIAILLVLIFLTARGTWGVYQKARDSRNNLAIAQKAHDEVETRQNALAAQISALGTSRGIEEEIRGRFEVAMPGEQVTLIVDEEQEVVPAEELAPTWWEELIRWIGIDS